MKKQIIIGLLLLMVVFTTSSMAQEQKTRINEYCNFAYMDYCLVEVPRWDKVKLYNIIEDDTLFDFYNLGEDKYPHGMIIDGDTEQMVYFNPLIEGQYLKVNGQTSKVKIRTVLYDDVGDVLYVVFTR